MFESDSRLDQRHILVAAIVAKEAGSVAWHQRPLWMRMAMTTTSRGIRLMRSLLVKGSDVWPLCFDFDAGATQYHHWLMLCVCPFHLFTNSSCSESRRERPWLLVADMELP